MKYMHFNSSCSYTSLAILLEEYGIDTEDTKIALEIGLPYLFRKDREKYEAGAMLQGKEWFDLYLNPNGLSMNEKLLDKNEVFEFLCKQKMCMLGLKLPNRNEKHAVVFYKNSADAFYFLNPKRKESDESSEISLSKEELFNALEDMTLVGTVEKAKISIPNKIELFNEAIITLRENLNDIYEFSSKNHMYEEYIETMNTLFRPILLDGIIMLDLIGEVNLANDFRIIQKEYLQFLKGNRASKLCDYLSMDKLNKLVDKYIFLIEKHIEQIT